MQPPKPPLPDSGKREPQVSPWRSADEMIGEAVRITSQDRNDDYGDPEDDFADIALAWTASLRARGLLSRDKALTAADVPRMMAIMKAIRDSNRPKRDNRVDSVGYMRTLERVEPTEAGLPSDPVLRATTIAAIEDLRERTIAAIAGLKGIQERGGRRAEAKLPQPPPVKIPAKVWAIVRHPGCPGYFCRAASRDGDSIAFKACPHLSRCQTEYAALVTS